MRKLDLEFLIDIVQPFKVLVSVYRYYNVVKILRLQILIFANMQLLHYLNLHYQKH